MTVQAAAPPKKRRAGFSRQEWAVLGTLLLGVFMGSLDITIVAPTLPSVVADFHTDFRAVSWTMSLYVLAYVVGSPLMTALSDRFGRRRLYLIDVGLFVAGSVLCAAAPAFWVLLVGRAVQALGAGGILPVASAVATETVPKERRGAALGIVGSMWGVAAVLGPNLGGVLTQHFGWRSVFWLNIPIGALVAFLAMKNLPAAAPRKRGRFDVLGIALLASGLLGLTAGLNQIGRGRGIVESLQLARVWGPLAAGFALLALFVWAETKAEAPIIRPSHLFKRNLAVANVLSLAAGTNEAGMVFVPAFAVAALSYSKQQAGSVVTVIAIALFFGTPLTGMLLDRFGAKKVLVVSTLLTALGNYLFGQATTTLTFFGSLLVLGLGLSALLGAPLRFIAANETDESDRAATQGVLSVFASTGISLGAAVTGALVQSSVREGNALEGYRNAYWVVSVLGVVGFLIALMLGPTRSREATSN
ncbi:MAG: MFS transporter [Deltaproteobacteria bacterium]|nr:MFS transporter [Deltaproteobacteria bacterium]